MKRRDFGILTGSGVLGAALAGRAAAQTAPDPNLLKTTLTPMGAERAGNADGSIPAWTGGLTTAPLPPNTNVGLPIFTDEKPLYTVDASNMAQYQNLLSPATQVQITKYGMSLKVYPTHRTAAAPQYVYDNAFKNVTRAQLDPRGGRFGFTGAVGGPPFPIINTADPAIGGIQLIWNHLVNWPGYSIITVFAPGCVVTKGGVVLVNGATSHQVYPYYAPDVTPESFDGYFSKGFYSTKAPAQAHG